MKKLFFALLLIAQVSYADNIVSSKLPILASGAVPFSDDLGLTNDYSNLKWNINNTRFLIGDQGTLSGDIQGAIRAFNLKPDGSSSAIEGILAGAVDVHIVSTGYSVIGLYDVAKMSVASGASAQILAGMFAPISRVSSGDEGTVGYAVGVGTGLTQGNNAQKVTGLYTSYLSGFHSIDSNPNQITNFYDFLALGGGASINAAAVTNMYGIVIEPYSGYTKKNWISGTVQTGGSSLQSIPSALLVAGGVTVQSEPASCDGAYSGTIRYSTSGFEGCHESAWSSLGGAAGANTYLSNLTGPTAVNLDLIFDTGTNANIKTTDGVGVASDYLTLHSGDSDTAGTGGVVLLPGTPASGFGAGPITLQGANSVAASATSIFLTAGSDTTSGNGGDIVLQTGASASGIAGRIIDNNSHFLSTQASPPSINVTGGAGAGASCDPALSNTDRAGAVSIVTGVGPSTNTSYCDVTFDVPYENPPMCFLQIADGGSYAQIYPGSTTTELSIKFVAGITSTGYTINYHCIEMNP